MGKRELIVNWSQAHGNLKAAIENDVTRPDEIAEVGRGWTYVTFVRPGTAGKELLFDIDRLESVASVNGFFLPRDVVSQHNKIVVTASSSAGTGWQLYGLYKLLEAYAKAFANERAFPLHAFYGKLGGVYERESKGRVLSIYSTDDDGLLDILASLEELLESLDVSGVTFTYRLANGLSAIPRMLHGFDDPQYRESGSSHYRISDPTRFTVLIDQARGDYNNYRFDKQPSI